MHSKFFVALNFVKNSHLSFKVDGFKKRFDSKYHTRPFPHMALLAPFEIRKLDKNSLIDELNEEIDTFFFDFDKSPKISFSGLGFSETKKKKVIYLKPNLGDDLTHLRELVTDICKSFIPREKKYKENESQFVPLGSFFNPDLFLDAMSQAQMEFSANGELAIEGISLYEQKNGQWIKVEDLIDFDNSESFLHLSDNCL